VRQRPCSLNGIDPTGPLFLFRSARRACIEQCIWLTLNNRYHSGRIPSGSISVFSETRGWTSPATPGFFRCRAESNLFLQEQLLPRTLDPSDRSREPVGLHCKPPGARKSDAVRSRVKPGGRTPDHFLHPSRFARCVDATGPTRPRFLCWSALARSIRRKRARRLTLRSVVHPGLYMLAIRQFNCHGNYHPHFCSPPDLHLQSPMRTWIRHRTEARGDRIAG